MVRLSVNINKIATLRNARGGNVPNVVEAAINAEKFGAHGITIHPRPDQRHITYQDVIDLKGVVTTEFNIEGYPSDNFIDLVCKVRPAQVTLVPDAPDALTSNAGWDTATYKNFLADIIKEFQKFEIRTSIFVDADKKKICNAVATGTNRIELYTEPYAANYSKNKKKAIAPFIEAAEVAHDIGLGINAGHDLSLKNLNFFASSIPGLVEVSIGHALISDAIYFGLEATIKNYLKELEV